MASVVRRLRRSVASKRTVQVFRSTSTLRGVWTRGVGLPFLERKYELYGLSGREYQFYLRRSKDLARWEAGRR